MSTLALNSSQPLLISPAIGKPILIGNKDTANSVIIGPRGLFAGLGNAIALDPAVTEIDPLGFSVFDGMEELWGLSLAGNPVITVQPGSTYWAPSAVLIAQQVQKQLQPTLQAASVQNLTPGNTATLVTFSAQGRLWAANLAFALSTNTNYSNVNIADAHIETSDLGTLFYISFVVANAVGQNYHESLAIPFSNPMPIAAGDSIILGTSGAITDTTARASATVLYSIP